MYSSAYCKFAKDLWLAEDVLKIVPILLVQTHPIYGLLNCLMAVIVESKDRDAEIIGHDSETDGPYYVAYEKVILRFK